MGQSSRICDKISTITVMSHIFGVLTMARKTQEHLNIFGQSSWVGTEKHVFASLTCVCVCVEGAEKSCLPLLSLLIRRRKSCFPLGFPF